MALSDSIGQVRDRFSHSLSVRSEDVQLSYNGACIAYVVSACVCLTECTGLWCATGECLSVEALVSELGVGAGGELELNAYHSPKPPKGVPKGRLEKTKAQDKGQSPETLVDKTVEGPSRLVGEKHAPPRYTMPSAFTVQVQSSEPSTSTSLHQHLPPPAPPSTSTSLHQHLPPPAPPST